MLETPMMEACELCKTGTRKAFSKRTRRTIGSSIRGVPNRHGDQDGGQVLQGFARFYGDAVHSVVDRFRGMQL